MKEYRILIEVDRYGEPLESIAVLDCETDKIVEWKDTQDEAVEYIEAYGKLACED